MLDTNQVRVVGSHNALSGCTKPEVELVKVGGASRPVLQATSKQAESVSILLFTVLSFPFSRGLCADW